MTRHTPQFLQTRESRFFDLNERLEQTMASVSISTANAPAPSKKVDAKDLKPEDFTKPYCDFMTGYPTVFHAVDYFKTQLQKAGYKEVGRRFFAPHTPHLRQVLTRPPQ